jgi:penicillin amidase
MNVFKWIISTLLFLVFLAFTFWLLFYIQYRQIQPSYPESLALKGILSPASIKVDSSGTAHIFAENEQDLITLMGYYVASKHLWEMELMRRAGQGRLSEIFGESTFEFDLMFRNLQFDSLSLYLYQNLSEDSKEWLEWYANGVNLFIAEKKANLPIKFQLMEFQPEDWKARDAVLIYRFVSWLMTKSWKIDFFFRLTSNQLPAPLLKFILYGNNPFNKLSKDSENGMDQIQKLWEIDSRFRKWWGILPGQYSESGWVVNGKRLTTGKGMLINEEPFGKGLPFNWVEVHLSSPELSAAGFAIPGIPGIFVGRNKELAWGMTRFSLKETEYYSGTIESQNKSILIGNESLSLGYHKENISIRNREKTFIFLVYKASRLPILKPALEDIQTNTVVSLDWTGWYHSDEILCLRQVAKAKNREEFYNAASHFKIPAEIFSFADRNDNIGLQFAAAVPRTLVIKTSPSRNGQSQNVRWSGFVTYEELPNFVNPGQNWASTSSLADDISFKIRSYPPTTIETQMKKIMIQGGQQISPRTIDTLLTTEQNLQNVKIVSSFLESLNIQDIQTHRDINIEDIVWLLSKWNGEIDYRSVPAFVFQLWKWFMFNNLFADQMGEELFSYFIQLPELYEFVFQQIVMDENNPWFDGTETPDIVEQRSDIIKNSFKNCIDFLHLELGEEIHRWQWKNFNISERYAQSTLPESFEDFLIEEAPVREIENKHSEPPVIGLPSKYLTVVGTAASRTVFVMDWQDEDGYQSIKGASLISNLQVSPTYRTFNTISKEELKTIIKDKNPQYLLNISISPQ